MKHQDFIARFSLVALAATLLPGTAPALRAASHTWSGAVNGLFSNAGNWSSGGAPTLAETNTLSFPSSATRFTVTNDIGALKVATFTFSGSNYIVRGASTFTVEPALLNINCQGSSNAIESPLSFVSAASVIVGTGDSLILSGALSGANGMTKNGEGSLFFKGAASNPLSGDLTVYSGELHFQKSGGATAYSGANISLGTTDVTDPTQLFLHADNQIPDGAAISVQPSGALVMNGFADTVGTVTMYSGIIDTDTNTLVIAGDLNLSPRFVSGMTYESPIIQGKIEFAGASASINVSSNTCNLAADIVENGTATAINKTGPGQLTLNGGGNFTGQFNVLQGTVHAGTVNSLGGLAGITTVSNGASLILSAGLSTSESLVLSGLGDQGAGALQLNSAGTTTCYGNITLSNQVRVAVGNSGLLALNGLISGPGGLEKTGTGDLWLTGITTNTFTGASFVNGGLMRLNKNANVRAIGSVTVTNGASLVFNNHEQMDNAGVLSLHTGATVDLLNRNETIGGLNLGSNVVNTGTGLLTLQGNLYAGPPYATNYGAQATFRGNLSLGGATRLWQATNASLVFDCPISDGAGVGGFSYTADGGTLWLLRSNSFTGPASIMGTCYASNAFAFGAPGGGVFSTNTNSITVISYLQPLHITGETLTVGNYLWFNATPASSNGWHGPVVTLTNSIFELAGGDASLTVSGQISGPGRVNVYSGLLRLTASNTYSGIATIESPGTLAIQHPNALGATTQGTRIEEGGTLLLELPGGGVVTNEALHFWYGGGSTSNTVDWLAVAGPVTNTWRGPVTVEYESTRVSARHWSGVLVFDTAITGDGGFYVTGPGTVILAGTNANTYPGDTVVNSGSLVLSKPNGVQATSNLVADLATVLWLGSEQMADGAKLDLGNASAAYLGTNIETITQLALDNGAIYHVNGLLKLLGDVDMTSDNLLYNDSSIQVPLLLSAGSHFIGNTDPAIPATLYMNADARDLTTNGGLSLSNVTLRIAPYTTNTFSGPVNLEASVLQILSRYGLGSPAQGVTMDQASALYLDLPHGHAIEGESLTVAFNPNQPFTTPRIGSETGAYATNGWSGPIHFDYDLSIVGPDTWGLDLGGPITDSGDPFVAIFSFMSDTLFLTGTASNNFGRLQLYRGKARLAKSPGVRAVGAFLYAESATNPPTQIHIDAPGQLPPDGTVQLTGSLLYLHDNPTTVRVLQGGSSSAVDCGINPASALTISNSALDTASTFSGDFDGTLIKQGTGTASFSGYFQNGDLFVQGGTFNRTALGVVGQTVISPGAVVNSSGPNIFNFGALSGGGTLNLAGNNTWVGGSGGGSTFTGAIIGTNTGALLTKLGAGALTLAGPVSLISTTLVQNGTLIVNTVMTNPVIVTPLAPGNQPTLGGTGQVGNVTVSGLNSRIAPGATTNVPSYGRLGVANLTLSSNSYYFCEIGGTNAGVDLDQIDASGTVNLNLAFSTYSAFGAAGISNLYVTLKSPSPVSGTFANHPEGDVIYPAPQRIMQITYLLSGGTEVTLVELAAPPLSPFRITGVAQLTNGHISLVGTGAVGAVYSVLTSTNVAATNWANLGSVMANGAGAFSFTDNAATNFPQRFYRFQLQ